MTKDNTGYYFTAGDTGYTEKLFVLIVQVSHRPSSNPTQMLVLIPEAAFCIPVSSAGEGAGAYSRHRTGESTCRLFTYLGVGLLRENISMWP